MHVATTPTRGRAAGPAVRATRGSGRVVAVSACLPSQQHAKAGAAQQGNRAGEEVLPSTRRDLLAAVAASLAVAGAGSVPSAEAGGLNNPLEYKKEVKARRRKIPESDFLEGPEGIKYYDLEVGSGAEAKVGSRVAVHYDIKYRGVTFMTSRQGMGVTGGTPLGFDVGIESGKAGSTLTGLDLGVRGMRVGGLRKLLVPPELGYGDRGIGEIPPNTTLTIDVELLSIKTSPLGYRTKLVEG